MTAQQPASRVVAKLIFVHGFSEHINRYNDFFPLLAAQGIQVFGWDQRGWGRSVKRPSEKGLTGPTSQVLDDVAAFIKDKLPSDVPVFVMGHSMGGNEVLSLMGDAAYQDVSRQIRGWILECPFIAFTPAEEPSSITVFMGRLAGRVLPNFQLKRVIPPELLSRNPAVVESIRNDPLCHNTGTLQGLAGLLDRTALLTSGAVKAPSYVQSVMLAHGTDDKVCSFDAAMKWLKDQDIQDKKAATYTGGYHQLHSDHCREEFTKDLVEWILKRSEVADKTGIERAESAAVESKL